MKRLINIICIIILLNACSSKMDSIENGLDYNVTESGVWEIYSGDGLRAFAAAVNGDDSVELDSQPNLNAILMSDIDLEGEEWNPIGGAVYYTGDNGTTSVLGYSGVFDGNDKVVRGLKISSGVNTPGANFANEFLGLFGLIGDLDELGKGVVKNLTIEEPSISGYKRVGGISGVNAGTIENCSVEEGRISANSSVGAIAGENNYYIRKSTSATAVNTFSYGGGIAGVNRGFIIASNNWGLVYGEQGVGGIASDNQGIIIGCSNTGNVNSDSGAGGIVFFNGNSVGDAIIATSSNNGRLSVSRLPDSSNVIIEGGVAAFNSAHILGCYHDGRISASGGAVGDLVMGGVVGINDGAIAACYSSGEIFISSMQNNIGVGRAIGINSREDLSLLYWVTEGEEVNIGVGFGADITTPTQAGVLNKIGDNEPIALMNAQISQYLKEYNQKYSRGISIPYFYTAGNEFPILVERN